jgi:hypothetical protein
VSIFTSSIVMDRVKVSLDILWPSVQGFNPENQWECDYLYI